MIPAETSGISRTLIQFHRPALSAFAPNAPPSSKYTR